MKIGAASAHGCAAVFGSVGLFVRGPSGSGKSRLTDTLVEEATKQGIFARLVADDRVFLGSANGKLIAASPETISGQIEHRHLGIERIEFVPSAVMDLVVNLVPIHELERLPDEQTATIDGVGLPILSAPEKCLAVSVPLVFAALRRLADRDSRPAM